MITDLLKRVKENWQILATLLIFWSIFDLYNYYSPFGIEIQSYVSISEILLLTFPTILNGLIAILLILLFFTIGLRNKKIESDPQVEEFMNHIDEYHNSLFHFKQNFKYLKAYYRPFKLKNLFSIIINILAIIMEILFLLFILVVTFEICKLFISESVTTYYPSNRVFRFAFLSLLTFFFLSPIFFLITEYFEKYSHKIFANLSITNNPLIYFAIGFVFNSMVSNRMQYLSILNGHENKKVSFSYDNEKIETNSSLVYIGSTQSYIFLRNNKEGLSLILKKDEIKNLTTKEIRTKK